MTTDGKINAIEALERLGLYNPANGTQPNPIYLTYLYKRKLLKRFKIGHRTIFYRIVDCDKLLIKVEKEGLLLTSKPTNQKIKI